MIFVNTTPHRVFDIDSKIHFDPDMNHQVRVVTQRVQVQTVDVDVSGADNVNQPVALYQKKYGDLDHNPPVLEGVMYIVSLPVKQACPTRTDFVSPSDLVRNEKGEIIGCKGFDI